jgi:hypothetical protein
MDRKGLEQQAHDFMQYEGMRLIPAPKEDEFDNFIIHYADASKISKVHILCDHGFIWSKILRLHREAYPQIYVDVNGRYFSFNKEIVNCRKCLERLKKN